MESQTKLTEEPIKVVEYEMPEPEVKVTVNTFMTAGGLVKEEIIRKTWLIPRA